MCGVCGVCGVCGTHGVCVVCIWCVMCMWCVMCVCCVFVRHPWRSGSLSWISGFRMMVPSLEMNRSVE